MEVPGRSYAWDGERMPHQRSSADGEPSSSGRLEARCSGSGNIPLRSLAQLPRGSRSGSESLPMQPAEDVLVQTDEQAARRTIGLKARPPSTTQRSNLASTGHRTRRGSIANFFRSGGPSQESSAAPSRDTTLQGMAGLPASGSRSRRSSFLSTFGINTTQSIDPYNDGGDVGSAPLPDGMTGAVDLAKSLQPPTQGRRRRASMLDLFRPLHSAEASVEGGEAGPAGETLARTKSSSKSRRGSVIDFFRPSNTGLSALGEEAGPGSASMNRRLQRGESGVGSRAQRRRSVIDILGQSSKKVFAKLMNQEFEDQMDDDDMGLEGKLWFTSLNDFKPLTFKYLSGRYSSAFFACSVKTGQHYILKKFEKGKMSVADERGVRRALHFAEVLEHEHIVQCCGLWEDEEALYIVEEYAVKGDLLQDSMSHPEKYTEAFMATRVVKPLLDVLVYLHSANVVHRAIFPEYVMFGREDSLKLGHFTSAIDQRVDPPIERIPFLDYMAPEMLSVRSTDDIPPGAVQPQAPMVAATAVGKGKSRARPPPSNDGSFPFPRSGPSALLPPSTGTPVFDFGDSRTSQQQQQQQQQPPNGPPRRPASTSGTQLLELFGLSGHNTDTADSGDKLSPVSRGNTRSAFNLFRSARRISQLQQQQAPIPSDDDRPVREASSYQGAGSGNGTRRFRGETAGEAPWLLPTDGSAIRAALYGNGGVAVGGPPPTRRRKSVVDEMSAPWLTPVGSAAQYDIALEGQTVNKAAGDGTGRSSCDGDVDGGEMAISQTPVMETTSAGATADGTGEDAATATAAAAGNGGPSGESLPASGDGGVGGSSNGRSPSHITGIASPAKSIASTVPAAAQLDGGGDDHSPVEKLSSSPKNSLQWTEPSPPSSLVSQAQQHQAQQPQQPHRPLHQQQQQALGADDASAPPLEAPPPPTPPPPLRSVPSCRRSCSAPRQDLSMYGPGSPVRSGGGNNINTGGGGTPLSPPLPRTCSGLGPNMHTSALGPSQTDDGRLPDRDECLPGYAAGPLTHCNSTGLRSQTSRLQPADSLPVPLTATPVAPVVSTPPGPVMESLLMADQTPMLPYDGGGATDLTEVKRVRGMVSFTDANCSSGSPTDAGAGDAYVDDGRVTRSSRMVSREPSTSSGQGGQVMMGLRTMARNITVRIGMVLGGRSDLLSPGGAAQVESSAWGDTMDGGGGGGGGGGGRDPSPRPSCPGAGEATALIMPNNPWEWQYQYNEKVDVWQVGCLAHEILCLSLPFETEDKLLACALILWADIVSFPDHLSSECHDFLRVCLTKNPAERPSAAELLQHPWIVRHAAREVLKSVRQRKEDENLTALSNGQQLTVWQRAAVVVGLGWIVGAGSAPAAAAGAKSPSSTSMWSRLSWMLRPWTSKVSPAEEGVEVGKDEAENKLALAMAMVQEQQQQHHHHHHQQPGTPSGDRTSRRKSSDVEAARKSVECIRQHQHQQQLQQLAQMHVGTGGGGGRGSSETTSRWGAVL